MLRSKIYEFELEKKREVTKKIEDSNWISILVRRSGRMCCNLIA